MPSSLTSAPPPAVDVNLFAYNAASTIATSIDSVLAQTWPNLAITLIDDGSTDATPEICAAYAARHPNIRLKRNRANTGAIANFQRAFWFGNNDFVLPKSADDIIGQDFVARTMDVLLTHPETAMCHAAGLVFTEGSEQRHYYPSSHALHAVGRDPVARTCHVMAQYTSSPSFWGVYRRTAVDQLSQIRFRSGWDHVVLAELALYGEIRHVPEPLYYRRNGGKPVLQLARASTEQGTRGAGLDGVLAEQRWRTPLITNAYAHLEAFAASRLPHDDRIALMAAAVGIFRARWLPAMRHEAAALRARLPGLIASIATTERVATAWLARQISDAIRTVETILPEEDFTMAHLEIAALAGEAHRRREAA
jgi:hypothetical protein